MARPNHKTFRWKSAVIVDSSFCAVINAPIEKIDIPVWRLSLRDEEYQGCSPAHFAAGSITARDGTDNLLTCIGSLEREHDDVPKASHCTFGARSV